MTVFVRLLSAEISKVSTSAIQFIYVYAYLRWNIDHLLFITIFNGFFLSICMWRWFQWVCCWYMPIIIINKCHFFTLVSHSSVFYCSWFYLLHLLFFFLFLSFQFSQRDKNAMYCTNLKCQNRSTVAINKTDIELLVEFKSFKVKLISLQTEVLYTYVVYFGSKCYLSRAISSKNNFNETIYE